MAQRRVVQSLFLLGCCEFLFIATLSIGNTLTGIVGATLTTNKALVTLPYAAMTLFTALATVAASHLMRRVGRRAGFLIGGVVCFFGGLVAVASIYTGDFILFCVGYGLIGVFKAFAQYYRFAAAEVTTAGDQALKARAISLVFIGCLLAALIGPQIGTAVRGAVPWLPYAGSFMAIAVMGVLTVMIALLLRLPEETGIKLVKADSGRPLRIIARQPTFIAAVASCTIGYAVMAFVMAASPIAVVNCGNPVTDAAFVMQIHLAGMYGPSFFTGRVIGRLGVRTTIAAGAVVLLFCGIVALSGTSMIHFAAALFVCGVGWNWMYIGGTTLLTETYKTEERAKAQACNEFIMFAAVTAMSFATGFVLRDHGWDGIQYAAMPLLVVALAIIGWSGLRRSQKRWGTPTQFPE
jgi:MFS family permease